MIVIVEHNRADAVLLAKCDTAEERAHVRRFAACVAVTNDDDRRGVKLHLYFQSKQKDAIKAALRYLHGCADDWNAAH